MKSEVKQVDKKPTKPYPKLMISDMGTIVLFTSKSRGISVKESKASELGVFSDCWESSDFTDFEGTVTLSND